MVIGNLKLAIAGLAVVALGLPMTASAKDVCLKTADNTRYIKLSGLKNLKKAGKVSPLYGYYRVDTGVAITSTRQVLSGAAIGVGDGKVRLSLTLDRRLGMLILVPIGGNLTAELHSLTATSADVKTLAGTYTHWSLGASQSYAFEPIKCKEADVAAFQ